MWCKRMLAPAAWLQHQEVIRSAFILLESIEWQPLDMAAPSCTSDATDELVGLRSSSGTATAEWSSPPGGNSLTRWPAVPPRRAMSLYRSMRSFRLPSSPCVNALPLCNCHCRQQADLLRAARVLILHQQKHRQSSSMHRHLSQPLTHR